MLVAALFAQSVLAAHACVAPGDSAVQALKKDTLAEVLPCHETEKPSANECLMHCTQSDQVNLDQQHMVAVRAGETVLHIALPVVQQKIQTARHSLLPLNTGPPLNIRYCSFLI